mgnify:CR=1 FL=1
MLLNNQQITEERRQYQKMPRDKWQWKHDHPEPREYSKSNSQNEVYSDTIWPQESRKFSNKLILHLRQLKQEQTKPEVSWRKPEYQSRNKWNND